MNKRRPLNVVVVGAGIGGLTTGALLAQQGFNVTVLEAHTYPGGCAGTFYHKGYRFDAGATVAGGFQAAGPHTLVAKRLDIEWPVHPTDTAWVVHLPDHTVSLTQDQCDVFEKFPATAPFWREQQSIADVAWAMAADGLPWPPGSFTDWLQLARTGIQHFPANMRALPLTLRTTHSWLDNLGLADDKIFMRFIDAQLLISAQTTARHANALYGATALDLPRQGVYHVAGGMGGLAETLIEKIRMLGGKIHYRHRVQRIIIENRRVTGVEVQQGRHNPKLDFIPCDILVANLPPANLNALLGKPATPHENSSSHGAGWGAFVLHLGVDATLIPNDLTDHHQIIADLNNPLGEGNSAFMSLSPKWDHTRAPTGHRAVSITTHTETDAWWTLRESDADAYESRKDAYAECILTNVEHYLPGFRRSIVLTLHGSPITYQYYTGRYRGMVGGFPQTSLFKSRGSRVGIHNLRMVGDSIFPGQSTAGVTLGAIRVAHDLQRTFPRESRRYFRFMKQPGDTNA